jgi:hypothetical protein
MYPHLLVPSSVRAVVAAVALAAAALGAGGCAEPGSQRGVVDPTGARSQHQANTTDTGGAPAAESNGKTHATERTRSSSESSSKSRDSGGSTRPTGGAPPRNPPPHR